jgi:hypothetical protein
MHTVRVGMTHVTFNRLAQHVYAGSRAPSA